MKAIVLTRFGPPEVLQLQEVPKPAPKEHEVLIRVRAATVSAGDCELRGLRIPMAYRIPIRVYVSLGPKPTILGQELAGDIEAVGSGVTRFQADDAVVAWPGFGPGGYAEYACMSETGVIAAKPSTMSYEEAAPLAVGGLEAVHFLRNAHVQKDERALIVGAGGSIGTFAVQIARNFGAHVTAVDRSEKHEMLRSIGADEVVDSTREDFTDQGETYDIILDVVGTYSFNRVLATLRPRGRYLMGNPRLSHRLRARLGSGRDGPTVVAWAQRTASEYAEDFRFLRGLLETGKLKTVIDRRYPLEQTAEAHRYVQTGQKKGNVVISVSPDPPST